MSIQLPKFTLLEKSNLGGHCDRCDRSLKNVYVIKNNETKEVQHFGSGCAKKVMGISITDVVRENIAYDEEVKRQARLQEEREKGKTFIQSFAEADADMLDYIEANPDNNFIKDMRKRIEEYGSLTEGQYNAVAIMMIPFEEIEKDTKVDMIVTPVKMVVNQNRFGWNYTIMAVTEDNTKVRIYFSSLNDQKENLLRESKVLEIDEVGNLYGRTVLDSDFKISLRGTFDGYKIKRAKINKIQIEKVG